jgi:hypothetical protein
MTHKFKLDKVLVMTGETSLVAAGESYTGKELRMWDWETDVHKTVKQLSDIVPGWQLILTDADGTYLRTSKIDHIVHTSSDAFGELTEVVFKTQTSVYRIREVSND